MPIPITLAQHQAGLDRMARLVDPHAQAGQTRVATMAVHAYCLVHLQLFSGAGGARDLRGVPAVGTADTFEDTLAAAVLQHAGAFALHRRVFVVPLNGDSGLAVAEAIWLSLLMCSTPENNPNPRPSSWRAGDVVYVHYPEDGGIAVAGGVIPADGDPLPNWP